MKTKSEDLETHVPEPRLRLISVGVSATLTVKVLEVYEDRLDQVVALALFSPLFTGTGGNTGNQAATTVTHADHREEGRGRSGWVLSRTRPPTASRMSRRRRPTLRECPPR